MDEFKINGYSSYMQKWGDGLLLGFGPDADDSGRTTGLKLTMFDNSDPDNLKELSTITINSSGDETYSEDISSDAVWERKALIIDPQKNIIGFPVYRGIWNATTEIYTSKQYYSFYSFENGMLNSLGDIYFDMNSDCEVMYNRAVMIGEYVYMLSCDEFKSADIATFKDLKTVQFN
jgi:uncharacterized secreted protein with C-terminal beta-propeller domain